MCWIFRDTDFGWVFTTWYNFQRSLQVIGNGVVRYITYDSLLALQSNCTRSKIVFLTHVCLVLLLGMISLHFAWVVDDAKCIVVTRVCVSVCPRRTPTLLLRLATHRRTVKCARISVVTDHWVLYLNQNRKSPMKKWFINQIKVNGCKRFKSKSTTKWFKTIKQKLH